ncbi:MAG: helix-hairpin-helix domain-containing protein, partial [Dehalococcoidia bacterium]
MPRLPQATLHRLNLVLLAAIVVAVVVLAARCGGATGIAVIVRDPRPGIDEIRVDVAGAVLLPGVVIAQPGERVIDAIERAGGFAEDADRAALNLARRVVDQDRIRVPRLGEAEALLDINSATAQQLEALPGIGPVRSKQIVAAREAEGRFETTDGLLTRGVISEFVYEG